MAFLRYLALSAILLAMAAWLIWVVWIVMPHIQSYPNGRVPGYLTLSELGDFLSGALQPLVLLLLIMELVAQRRANASSTRALQEQVDYLKKTYVLATQPRFSFRADESVREELPEGVVSVYYIEITNIGADGFDILILPSSECELGLGPKRVTVWRRGQKHVLKCQALIPEIVSNESKHCFVELIVDLSFVVASCSVTFNRFGWGFVPMTHEDKVWDMRDVIEEIESV